jgi:hypothetical protein
MEHIKHLIQKSGLLTNRSSQTSLQSVSKEQAAWLTKWKSHSDVERQFSPNNWGYALSHPDKAYLAECPTLLSYERTYGEGVSADWIRLQVLTLYGSSNSKDIGIADGIKLFAQSFAQEVKNFKLSELMLFFARYKAGKYDNSYSSFDAKRIGNAFFSEFIKERNRELDRITREQVQSEIEERRFTPPDGYTSFSWYQELKRRASEGDTEAIRILTNQ